MSSSAASGNEQHMMAVRSPISTKAIFLYLEDGLPIRPTSVFNHNTLLEMNNTSLARIEVLKGPASSIYGSEAIGGSFNFITKSPTRKPSGSLGFQVNDLGLRRYELQYAQYANEKVGFYLGTHYVERKNGPVDYSDYEKLALTFKTAVSLSKKLQWTSVFDIIDYRSDMTGSLSEADYRAGNYESDQTFTERGARAFRFRSTLDKKWNGRNKTAINFIFRNNVTDQNPSYRITQFRQQGQLTGEGAGEVNTNRFRSFVGLIQHKTDFGFANSSLIGGISADFSPQRYMANSTAVTVDVNTEKNLDFTVNTTDFILNYKANILNYAAYLQYEIDPVKDLKLTAAVRYDGFDYDYNNLAEGIAGPQDARNRYSNLSPKLGANYNFSRELGVYANYSVGFTPPQVSVLYRNSLVGVDGKVFDLEPSDYDNYEIGSYFAIPSKLKIDLSFYLLNGRNTLITLRNEDDTYFNANAGKTRSYGIEYGITYSPIPQLSITHNGSYARHRYIKFFDGGVDYSGTDRETAPNLLGYSQIKYRPNFAQGLLLTASHELMGRYSTSFENQVHGDNGTTSTANYGGYSIFNLKASLAFKQFEVWGEMLNVFDTLYSVMASYNIYRHENTYSIGNPRTFHVGIKYNFLQ